MSTYNRVYKDSPNNRTSSVSEIRGRKNTSRIFILLVVCSFRSSHFWYITITNLFWGIFVKESSLFQGSRWISFVSIPSDNHTSIFPWFRLKFLYSLSETSSSALNISSLRWVVSSVEFSSLYSIWLSRENSEFPCSSEGLSWNIKIQLTSRFFSTPFVVEF